ncbi:hypothetical protein CLUG_01840 [Clavispora lusitaniae ATCC 42720]|uniref:Uncharacterized protein n=1 Tax=Clavispora lusitaniae (strain ATCC 42720) TaxID=306902 RepID=C4Y0V8_CLAL4|nr:uncharacterized protein CLUG_01840 [Clavispora lusitaniae ATCC 42720]EEQ37717.1 hypothetical protein CLUG_01840 [Clavispora lusitaniae ATCC 42720]
MTNVKVIVLCLDGGETRNKTGSERGALVVQRNDTCEFMDIVKMRLQALGPGEKSEHANQLSYRKKRLDAGHSAAAHPIMSAKSEVVGCGAGGFDQGEKLHVGRHMQVCLEHFQVFHASQSIVEVAEAKMRFGKARVEPGQMERHVDIYRRANMSQLDNGRKMGRHQVDGLGQKIKLVVAACVAHGAILEAKEVDEAKDARARARFEHHREPTVVDYKVVGMVELVWFFPESHNHLGRNPQRLKQFLEQVVESENGGCALFHHLGKARFREQNAFGLLDYTESAQVQKKRAHHIDARGAEFHAHGRDHIIEVGRTRILGGKISHFALVGRRWRSRMLAKCLTDIYWRDILERLDDEIGFGARESPSAHSLVLGRERVGAIERRFHRAPFVARTEPSFKQVLCAFAPKHFEKARPVIFGRFILVSHERAGAGGTELGQVEHVASERFERRLEF